MFFSSSMFRLVSERSFSVCLFRLLFTVLKTKFPEICIFFEKDLKFEFPKEGKQVDRSVRDSFRVSQWKDKKAPKQHLE